MKKFLWFTLLLVVLLSLSASAPGPNALAPQETPRAVAGFWLGIWHGFISPFTFIISLFNKNVNIYEVVNNGGWYNFGFLFGVSMFFGGGGRQSHRVRRK